MLTLSENPTKAIISLQSEQQTTYELFIKVQDELTKAYSELRGVYALQKFGKSIMYLTPEEIKETKTAYPFKLSEAETK